MEKTDAALVVADAGPLIHLDELSALDVLMNYSAVFVPDAVWLEVHTHRPKALENTNVRFVHEDSPVISEKINALAALYTLHRGEREAMELCLAKSVGVLLSDDTAARMACQTIHIQTHGTLGLLLRAVRLQLRTTQDVIGILESIPEKSSLHIRPELLRSIIEQARQEWAVEP
jgi:predicted nucleic acid-binding protein